ncbi:MerR family transcriptional regulator [Nocardia sp. bgisy118]|uniref:helix-turn-helix domain-containing protein n=1 Tax=Nocardia sp. bgisy118 TaxID=3413786 RepID=UPI003F49E152
MTENTRRDGLVSIGMLSQKTGVPVRTLRFYCDEGILQPHRSSGGHRLFDPVTTVDRVLLVRRLRGLGLSLTTIVGVLTDAVSITEAVAAERTALDTELGALRWRRASLVAVEDAPPMRRAARLALLATVHDRHTAYDGLVGFWRRLLAPLPSDMFDGFVGMNIPAPPTDPTPRQVVAYAELVTVTSDPAAAPAMSRQLWRPDPTGIHDKRELLTGVAEACAIAGPLVVGHVEPRPGAELDQFLAAHATARRERDTPRFRQRMLHGGNDTDPRIHRYWKLTTDITGETTAGAAHYWLYRALERATSPAAPVP